MGTASVAYDPSNPLQQAFLATLAQGETGSSSYSATEGVGGTNLAGSATDAYGFPQWQGFGNSHAAGIYQFEPATWDSEAQTYGLNFQNPSDQSAGAWYLAQDTYAKNTGGGDLTSALASGDYMSVQKALASTWPSVGGNASIPLGFANTIAANNPSGLSDAAYVQGGGQSPSDTTAGIGTPGTNADPTTPASPWNPLGWFAAIENWFVRGGMIFVGLVIVGIAIWALVARSGAVPGPKQAAKAVAAAI
jgi:hypothetical protein